MERLWAKTANFSSVNVGDGLPILVKWETGESIVALNSLLSGEDSPSHDPPDQAPQPQGSANASAPTGALLAYVVELLEKAFPVTAIVAPGSKLSVEHLAPVRDQDIISISGRVVGKRLEAGRRLVDCQVVVENERGQTIARALATVSL